MNIKNQKMKFYDSRLVEINALLTNTAVINRPSMDNNIPSNTNNDGNASSNLKNSLSNIKDYVILDPYRAKIELEKIISAL